MTKSLSLNGINFAEKATVPDRYPNVRCQMYLELAQEVRDGFWLCDEAKEELIAQSVFINPKGMQQLVPKSEVKKILGHSPDLCDALALAVFAKNHGFTNVNSKLAVDRAREISDKYLSLLGY